LSPLLILIAILVKLDSKGPVFYISKRAGNGYKIFDFYKFRSMRTGADAELKNLSHLNQYTDTPSDSVFFKLKNDPRVTKLGSFLRNTSLDELPQLINVLKGDMSLVGNRPLPLYEAEKLTKDQIAWRFLAPAGITGLWQVTKRGKAEMSEEERIQLDMQYAMNNSFVYDLKILWSTIPALLQKEKV
jgi:lipopolysaccharide/colanic/teichoic acid biosynthesis glycosyltransferase